MIVRKMDFKLLSTIIVTLLSGVGCHQSTQDNSNYYEVLGSISATISTNQISSDGSHAQKTVSLNRLTISENFTQNRNLMAQVGETAFLEERDYRKGLVSFSESPGAVDLGMNDVPVLDQGSHGTCVTFSTTAALDALLEKGDIISQQCTLALNKTLGNNYWDGAQHALQILRPLRKHGVVSKNQCTSYPLESMKLSKNSYQQMADGNLNVSTVTGNFIEPINLNIVRSALNNKHRIILGFGIKKDASSSIAVSGFNMLINGRNTVGGLWACQQSASASNYCGVPNSGHAVIITGYDDTQQLLKIRNSWSKHVGDDGDYYMTYKFFEQMSFNGTELY